MKPKADSSHQPNYFVANLKSSQSIYKAHLSFYHQLHRRLVVRDRILRADCNHTCAVKTPDRHIQIGCRDFE